MRIGYARVSTDDQNLALQRDALRRAGCSQVFEDHGVSGVKTDRIALTQALAALRSGDMLVVWRLDRLGRSLPHLIAVMAELGQRGITFQSVSEAIDTSTAGGKLVFHMMGALAEFEHSLISERTRAGMEAARARGVHLGRRPSLTAEQILYASKELEMGRATIADFAKTFGVAPLTLSRALRRRPK